LRLGQGRFERASVDREEKVAFLDELSISEVNSSQIPRHAGTDLNRIDRNETADVFVGFCNKAFGRLRDRDLRGRSRTLCR
jgi:hypothetical protein